MELWIMHVKVCVSHLRQPSNDAVCSRHQRVTLPFHQGSDDICRPPHWAALWGKTGTTSHRFSGPFIASVSKVQDVGYLTLKAEVMMINVKP